MLADCEDWLWDVGALVCCAGVAGVCAGVLAGFLTSSEALWSRALISLVLTRVDFFSVA